MTWADPCEVEVRPAATWVEYRSLPLPVNGVSIRFHLLSHCGDEYTTGS